MKTKPECLNLLAVMRRFRTKSAVRVAEFVSRFPLRSFLLQAPQVTADIWGVGIQLGSVMGFVGDAIYGALRAAAGQQVILRGPLASDPVSQALSYLSQPAYHYTKGDWLSYEDHWLLLAADIAATRIVMDAFSPSVLDSRADSILASPLVYVEPYKPETIAVLTEAGWRPGGPYRPPWADMGPLTTYREVLTRCVDEWPVFLREAREDFPYVTSAWAFQYALAELIEELLTWGTGTATIGKDVFDPEEYALARMFEFGIFPPDDFAGELVDLFTQRAVELARALGHSVPWASDLGIAAEDIFGGRGSFS